VGLSEMIAQLVIPVERFAAAGLRACGADTRLDDRTCLCNRGFDTSDDLYRKAELCLR
jgi:hypothetical protein